MRNHRYPVRRVRKYTRFSKYDGVMVEKLSWIQRFMDWFFLEKSEVKTYRFGKNIVTRETIWPDGFPTQGTYEVYTSNGRKFTVGF